MINYFDLGTGRMMIVPMGYEIVTPETVGQMIFTPLTMEEIAQKIEAGEFSTIEI